LFLVFQINIRQLHTVEKFNAYFTDRNFSLDDGLQFFQRKISSSFLHCRNAEGQKKQDIQTNNRCNDIGKYFNNPFSDGVFTILKNPLFNLQVQVYEKIGRFLCS
jgi:hypothetical protein